MPKCAMPVCFLALLRRLWTSSAGRHKENIFQLLRDPCGSKYARIIHRLSIRSGATHVRPVPRGQIESARSPRGCADRSVFAQRFV